MLWNKEWKHPIGYHCSRLAIAQANLYVIGNDQLTTSETESYCQNHRLQNYYFLFSKVEPISLFLSSPNLYIQILCVPKIFKTNSNLPQREWSASSGNNQSCLHFNLSSTLLKFACCHATFSCLSTKVSEAKHRGLHVLRLFGQWFLHVAIY